MGIQETIHRQGFDEHIHRIERGENTDLFPEHRHLSSRAPSEVPQQPVTYTSNLSPLNDGVSTEWLTKLGEAVNDIRGEQEKLCNLVIHSISQNNIMGSVNATIISQLREQIQSIEQCFLNPENKGNTTTGSSGHQNPPAISSSQKETLDTIVRKVSSIEHKITTGPPPLPGN